MRATERAAERAQRLIKLYDLHRRTAEEITRIETDIRKEAEAMQRARRMAAEADMKVSRRPEAACGTDSGYYRHRRKLRESACEACLLAHRLAERTRAQAARERESAGAAA